MLYVLVNKPKKCGLCVMREVLDNRVGQRAWICLLTTFI